MQWLYECSFYLNTLLVLAAMVLCFTWKSRGGKGLLCSFLVLSLFTMILFRVRMILLNKDIIEWSSAAAHTFSIVGMIGNVAAHVLLLSFVIVVAKALPLAVAAETRVSTAQNDLSGETTERRTEMTVGQALFSFTGRMRRSDYWLKGFLPLLPLGILNNILAYGVATDEARVIAIIISLISLWPALALVVKRLHDRNHSGWFALIYLIPIVGPIWILVEVIFLRGTTGPNRFGDDPMPNSD